MVSFKKLPSLITRYLLRTLSRNANISHIASGFIYCSPSQQKVRVDEAYDSGLGSSLFDYTNITDAGVANRQWTLHPAITSPPNLWQGYVSPAFPLIPRDFLVTNGAVFGGIVDDSYVGKVATVCSNNLLRAGLSRRIVLTAGSLCSGTSCFKEQFLPKFSLTRMTSSEDMTIGVQSCEPMQ